MVSVAPCEECLVESRHCVHIMLAFPISVGPGLVSSSTESAKESASQGAALLCKVPTR